MKKKKFEQSDSSSVINLLNLCFPAKHITDVSFFWKHFDPFFSNQTIAKVGIEDSRVVAFVCFTPSLCYSQNSGFIKCYSCAVQATHPDYRRRGYISLLTRSIENYSKIDHYFGFSNADGILIDKHSRSINYEVVGQLQTTHWFSNPFNGQCIVNEVLNVPLEFIEKKKRVYTAFEKSTSYLDWRYARHPKNTHQFFEVRLRGVVIGYSVISFSLISCTILEIIADENSSSYRQIIESIRHEAFLRRKLVIGLTHLPNAFWDSALPKFPLGRRSLRIYFTLKSARLSTDSNDWLITGGDIM